ncbi:MAG: hypothetical protein AAGF12_43080 [Myxococcota bacterium]
MGALVYEAPFEGGNTFARATCHALSEPAADGFRRPGHAIGNATRRASYKGGAITDLRTAVNTCVTEWMNAGALEADDPRWVALEGFLESQATVSEDPPVDLQIVQPPAVLTGGVIAEGRAFLLAPMRSATDRARWERTERRPSWEAANSTWPTLPSEFG